MDHTIVNLSMYSYMAPRYMGASQREEAPNGMLLDGLYVFVKGIYQLSISTKRLGNKCGTLVVQQETCVCAHESDGWLGDSYGLG